MTSGFKINKVLLLILFLIFLYISYLIVKPYFVAFIVSAILAYLFYPVYLFVKKYLKHPGLSAGVVIGLIIIVFLTVAFFLTNALIDQSVLLYQNIKDINIGGLGDAVTRVFGEHVDVNVYLKEIVNQVLTFVLQQASSLAVSIPKKAIALLVSLFILYYLFKEGEHITENIKRVLPLNASEKEELVNRTTKVLKATVYGVFITAVLQGIVGTIGFFIFGVDTPILFGLLLTIAATLPYLGTALVWVPISLYMISTGDYFNGIGLFIYGACIISLLDNVVRPLIISKQSQLHPITTFLGVLGGIATFGIVGIILGPLLLALFLTLTDFYVKEYEH